MKPSLTHLAALLAAALSLGAMEVSATTRVVRVLECMRERAPTQLRVESLRIEASGEGVTRREITARFYSQRGERGLRAMLHITAPADLAGMRYLLVEEPSGDALYLYLPALGKVRRVSGAGPDAEIAGTTLNYADLRLIGQALNAAAVTYESETRLFERSADVLRFVPAVADSPYRRVLATIDREHCVVLRAEFQHADGAAKRYQVEPGSLMRSGATAYASVATIEDPTRRSRVRLALAGVRTDARPPARAFDPRRFSSVD